MAVEEVVQTIERLNGAFDDLCVRGLRAAAPRDIGALRSMREEFERIGASHLATRIAALIEAIEKDDRGAAGALLRAQASLRVFERLLTLQVAASGVQTLIAGSSADTADQDNGDDEDKE
jgi:hypothetical protein